MEPDHRQLILVDVTRVTCCRNLISIEHAASAVLDVFCLVFRFYIELEIIVYGSIKNKLFYCILQIYNTKLCSFQNIILGFIVKIRKFHPRYSYKIYCKKGILPLQFHLN